MGRPAWLVLAAACAVTMTACGSDHFYRGMYEGTRIREGAVAPVDSVSARQARPDFDRYEAELRQLHPAPGDATLAVP